jgi:hypothetical protein
MDLYRLAVLCELNSVLSCTELVRLVDQYVARQCASCLDYAVHAQCDACAPPFDYYSLVYPMSRGSFDVHTFGSNGGFSQLWTAETKYLSRGNKFCAMFAWQLVCVFVDLRTVVAVRRAERRLRFLTVPEFLPVEWIGYEHLLSIRGSLQGLKCVRLLDCLQPHTLASLTTLELKMTRTMTSIEWPPALRRLCLHGPLQSVRTLPSALEFLELRGDGLCAELPDVQSVRLVGSVWQSVPQNRAWKVAKLVWRPHGDVLPANELSLVLNQCADALVCLDVTGTQHFAWPVLPKLHTLRTDYPVIMFLSATFQHFFPRLKKLCSLYRMPHDFGPAKADSFCLSPTLREITFSRHHASPLRVCFQDLPFD